MLDDTALHLHAHDLLISFQYLVANLHHEPKRDIGFFQRDHGILKVAFAFSRQLLNRLVRFLLQVVDLPNGVFEVSAEVSFLAAS